MTFMDLKYFLKLPGKMIRLFIPVVYPGTDQNAPKETKSDHQI
jgi:hypothetical protein